jgi:hypothetical protein
LRSVGPNANCPPRRLDLVPRHLDAPGLHAVGLHGRRLRVEVDGGVVQRAVDHDAEEALRRLGLGGGRGGGREQQSACDQQGEAETDHQGTERGRRRRVAAEGQDSTVA